MVWLFTQVWLWSIAGFLLGSLITWMLFAWPARRRLRAVARDYDDYVAATEARRERQVWRSHEPSEPLDETAVAEPVPEPTADRCARSPRPYGAVLRHRRAFLPAPAEAFRARGRRRPHRCGFGRDHSIRTGELTAFYICGSDALVHLVGVFGDRARYSGRHG